MEYLQSEPNDWVGKDKLGFVINASFSDDNAEQIAQWLKGLQSQQEAGLYCMPKLGLHITVLDWISPLLAYNGVDKRKLYESIAPEFGTALTRVTKDLKPFTIIFNGIKVSPGTIILVGHDEGQMQTLRNDFMEAIELPEGGKQPPTIVHSSIARFIEPSIQLQKVQDYVQSSPLNITQKIDSFRLIETRREPMQEFDVLKIYHLY